MASISLPPLPLPATSPALPLPAVGAVGAIVPAALLQNADYPAPAAPAATQVLPAEAAPAANPDLASMRPDQVVMARQLNWPRQDGASLAGSWRRLVRSYGNQYVERAQQAQGSRLAPALLLGGEIDAPPGRAAKPAHPGDLADTAWRFTVHANGAREQQLRVLGAKEKNRRRRERERAMLCLELVLDDGATVTVQAGHGADGFSVEFWSPDQQVLGRMRDLQRQLEAAILRAGLLVRQWKYHAAHPEFHAQARLPSAEAAAALDLSVFRALAELALLLPAA